MGNLYQYNKNTNEFMKVTSGGGSGSVLPYATYMANLPGSESELELLKTQLSDGCIIITNEANEEAENTPVVLLEKKAVAYIDSIPQDPAEFREFASTLQDGAIIVTNEDAPLSSRFMGEMVWSILPIDDSGAHLLDGAILTYSKYPIFYGYIKKLHDSGEYPNLFAESSVYEQSLTDYGVCGKFVIDTVNMTVRLPKITGIVEGTIDASALGDLVEAGLPNVEFDIGIRHLGNYLAGAADIKTNTAGNRTGTYAGNDSATDIGMINVDASRSSPVYGNSTTVQPQTIKGFLYIIVGATVGNITDVDIAGLAAHAAMPSSKYIDLELPESGGTVTAPADGWIYMKVSSAASGNYFALKSTLYAVGDIAAGSGQTIQSVMPVTANDIITITYSSATTNRELVFIYCNGNAPAE